MEILCWSIIGWTRSRTSSGAHDVFMPSRRALIVSSEVKRKVTSARRGWHGRFLLTVTDG